MKVKFNLLSTLLLLALMCTSCSTTTTFSFLCQDHDILIYVNGTYIGKELVTYTAPKGANYVDVECRKDGITILRKSIYIKGHNGQLLDLKLPNYNSYSSDNQIHSK